MQILFFFGVIPFFVLRFLFKVTKKQKNQLSCSDKMRIFYTENKQTGQLIFLFLVTLTKKQKTENGMNQTFILKLKNPDKRGDVQRVIIHF